MPPHGTASQVRGANLDPTPVLDLRYVKKIVEMLDESSLDAIEISTEKGLKIRVTKAAAVQTPVAAPLSVQMPMMVSAADPRMSPAGGIAIPAEAAPAPAAPAAPVSTFTEIKSPMVGTYYSATEPGAKPFVAVGSRVSKGQVLCIIEAMKIMNEIESDHDGVVKEILGTDAHPVEYGQVLFRVDPHG
ncbi:MAG: acetyl-CoA carboxylase biotin carboxyl carrier protein [Gemmatimonadetes bacterium]|nr:acetyl-CoA carboxylase biotin carboxyl carrier protein [Gemmatimonadota bacterium]